MDAQYSAASAGSATMKLRLESQRTVAQRNSMAENAARQAYCYLSYTTLGAGQFLLAKPVAFDVIFLDLPILSTGCEWDPPTAKVDPTTHTVNQPAYSRMPLVTAGVYAFDRDVKGHFIGAFLFFRVDADDNAVIHHDFVFTGPGTKNLAQTVLAGLNDPNAKLGL